ncbi:MAG: beta-eliminating lyase-related protein [Arenicellales bacterium WSBS_2016_MAG_OTU3]
MYCHELAHINTDECGAPEHFTGGAKLIDMQGDHGKISAQTLQENIYGRGNVHHAQPATVSITQACELVGCVYQLDEITAISETAHAHGLNLHGRRTFCECAGSSGRIASHHDVEIGC